MSKSRNCTMISQYNLPLYFVQRCCSLFIPSKYNVEAFFLVLQVLINSIYEAFIAYKIPTTTVSFEIWKQTEKGLIWRIRGMRKDLEAVLSRSSRSNLRDVGWWLILQEQNASTFLFFLFTISWRSRLSCIICTRATLRNIKPVFLIFGQHSGDPSNWDLGHP